jgi:colanic acid biosynthesis glycosyl transferase WcaI
MRICIINEFFHPDNTGGTGTVLSNLARELRDRYENVEIDVITSRNQYRMEGKPLPAYENWHGVHIHRLASPKPGKSAALRLCANFIFSCLALLQLLRQRRSDVVLVGTAPPTSPMAALLYKRLTGTPYVYITYDLDPDRAVALGVLRPQSRFVSVLKGLQRRWFREADRVVVLGRCMNRYLQDNYGLSPHKLVTIPIGFDPAQVVPAAKQTRFRAAHGLQDFVVLYAGNFGRYHDFDSILDAAKALGEKRITFALIGNGAQRDHILQRVESEHIANVRVFPFVPFENFGDMIASADACLVTLEKGMEGLCVPSKLYSNMAAGRPSLALVSRESEVALVVTESQSGVQIEPGDTQGLIRVLTRLAACPEEAERMGRNARRTLEDFYANSIIAAMYHRVFAEVVQSKDSQDLSSMLQQAPLALIHSYEEEASEAQLR